MTNEQDRLPCVYRLKWQSTMYPVRRFPQSNSLSSHRGSLSSDFNKQWTPRSQHSWATHRPSSSRCSEHTRAYSSTPSCSATSVKGSEAPYGPHIALLDYFEETERENNIERANRIRTRRGYDNIKCSRMNAVIHIQSWWRCWSTRARFRSLQRITRPWRLSGILQPNEGVVYGSVCRQLPSHGRSRGWRRENRRTHKVFLLLTTSARLVICDPINKRMLEQVKLVQGETTACDIGDQTFTVSSVPGCVGCSFSLTFQDLLSSSMIWIITLMELPSVHDLNRVCRRNSLRASNFPISMMGYLTVDAGFMIRKSLRIQQPRLGVVLGTRFALLRIDATVEHDFVELDQFTAVERSCNSNSIGFTIRSKSGESLQCYCKSETERDGWIEAITKVVSVFTVGFMRLGQRRFSTLPPHSSQKSSSLDLRFNTDFGYKTQSNV